jgi:hypothetical protein
VPISDLSVLAKAWFISSVLASPCSEQGERFRLQPFHPRSMQNTFGEEN